MARRFFEPYQVGAALCILDDLATLRRESLFVSANLP